METAVRKSNKENSKPELVKRQSVLQTGPTPLKEPHPAARKPLSQAFHTQQSTRHRKLVTEASLPPKTAPGTYKGRVVKSKIDCFRRPTGGEEGAAGAAGPNPDVRAPPMVRSGSASSKASLPPYLASRVRPSKAPGSSAAKSATAFSKPPSVPMRQNAAVSKPPTMPTRQNAPRVPARPPAVSSRAAPAASSEPSQAPKRTAATSKPASSTNRNEAALQGKPRPVPSATSQYSVRAESAGERRAKLAAWLSSKGRSLKRPAIVEKAAPRTGRREVVAAGDKRETGPEVAAAPRPRPQEVPPSKAAFSSSPSHIINTTLDLLDNSDLDLPADPDIRMESLVVNLCERLEAMETPSSSSRGEDHEAEVLTGPKVEDEDYEILEEEEEEEEDLKQEEQNGGEGEEETTKREEEEVASSDEDQDEDSTPADVAEGCVVKYSVKTTPFLQSVKKKLEGEVLPGTSGSRRKGTIKDLKYLTPVRRSSRIHRSSSRLPGMLNEHDPCVSSLAELDLLDDANAYIYRKNPALLQHQPQIQNLGQLITEER